MLANFILMSNTINLLKTVIIFGVDNSSSDHTDNEKKRYLNSWQRLNGWIRQYSNNSRS